MTSTRGVIGLGGVGGPHLITLVDQLKNLVIIIDELLLKASNLNRVTLIFPQG